MQPKVMKSIRERLMHLETLIGLKEKYEEHYIIDQFKKAMEGI
jgi:hypothetical protein